MIQNIFWSAYSLEERNVALNRIKEIINQYAFISHFQIFSDLSLSMTIEAEEDKINDLYLSLSTYLKLDEFDLILNPSNKERKVYLNITFAQGQGNLKTEIPEVPG